MHSGNMPDPAPENPRPPASHRSESSPASSSGTSSFGVPSSGAAATPHAAGATPPPGKDAAPDGNGLRSLSPLGLAAGGAAAATASVVGGQLGVAGTVIGAFLTSIVSATALAVYSESVKRGKRAVVKINHALAHGPADGAASSGTPAGGPGAAAAADRSPDADDGGAATLADDGSAGDADGRSTSRKRVLKIVVGALAMAAIAVVIVFGVQRATGTELSTGTGSIQRSVSGDDAVVPRSGGDGSTTPVEDPSSSSGPRESSSSGTPTEDATTGTGTPSSSGSATRSGQSSAPTSAPATTSGGRGATTQAPTGGATQGSQNQGAQTQGGQNQGAATAPSGQSGTD